MDSTEPGFAALILDVVGSRDARVRLELQADLQRAVERTNLRVPAVDPLAITLGDELQATYRSILAAILAAAYFRLTMIPTGTDVRAAIGWGDIVVHDPARSPLAQDGPAWWEAREVMTAVAASTSWTGYTARLGIRAPNTADPTRFAPSTDVAAADRLCLPDPVVDTSTVEGLWQVLAPLVDHALGQLTADDARIVIGDLDQRSTADIQAETGLSESSISSRRSRGQLREVVAALRAIEAGASR